MPADKKYITASKKKMVICDFDLPNRDYSLTFRDRQSLKVFMRFLKDNEYVFYIRDDKGRITPAGLEIAGAS